MFKRILQAALAFSVCSHFLIGTAYAGFRENMAGAAAGVDQIAGVSLFKAIPYCREDPSVTDSDPAYCCGNFCWGYIDEIVVEAMGKRIDTRTSPLSDPYLYQDVCAGVLYGLHGAMNSELAHLAIVQQFDAASQAGRAEVEIGDVKLIVRPSGENLLQCTFIKYEW